MSLILRATLPFGHITWEQLNPDVLGEWDGVNHWQLLAGAVLIVAGGALAGTSVK